ncbi:MAG: methyltransferase domain-containing protein, partial [Patescibacteria group bacterium]
MNTFPKNYFDKYYGGTDIKNPLQKLDFYRRVIIESLPELQKHIKLLDIGCGYGGFLKTLEVDKMIATYGIDAGDYAITYARQHTHRTKFWVTTVKRFKTNIKFHIITAFDVLEHISELDSALYRVSSLLAKNGRFICVVPVYDGIFGRIGG